ncbi:MAG: hypothetical protein GWN84_12745, partial [Gammaproteobacteria bacterium]|nr:hypothetical protein [Gammaproteobacteria bacterium]NIR85895.1 hypothetical protein [Gammaproteobacteria bacterium]NIR92086.1 hypothetical protein [Gammaproteobacteria bacterium]NIV51422.1 hypothetical protein [Gammaproteobacteria bacterium]NIV77107.1 hypothetical protein [Gammaproteobacteria bacterium]
ERDPRAGRSLLLYGLIRTLADPKGACLFSLGKLRDLDPEARRLAYELMELMAALGAPDTRWQRAVERLDARIRAGDGN